MSEARDKVAKILDRKFNRKFRNSLTKETILRLIPVAEMENLTDEELSARVEKLLRTDNEIEFVISEMEGGTARRPKKIGGRKEPRRHVTYSTIKL
jgi:hypothetical protein